MVVLNSFKLVFEEILNVFVAHHALVKNVSTGLGALHHFDNLGVRTSVCLTGLESSDCFLCHVLKCYYLISLWIVILLRMGLYFFNSMRSGVFLRFLVVM